MTAFATGITPGQILANVQQRLLNLRRALEDAADLQAWAAAISDADMATASGLEAADAGTLKSAIADAAALAALYETGLPPSTYPQPAQAYVYGNSQRQVIGPQ